MTAPTMLRKSPSWVYGLLAAFQVLDIFTTWWILSAGWGVEGNPVVATFINGTGLPAAMLSLLGFKLLIVYVLWQKGSGVKLASAFYGAVIFNNSLFLLVGLT